MANLTEDLFGIEKYINGLTDYILTCNTPMTIAIQGDWGTGKTSIMNMIKEKIEEECICSWFNTWEYSQFNMSDELAISLLKSLVDSLPVSKKTNKINDSLKVLASGMKTGALMAIDFTAGGRASDSAERFIGHELQFFTDIETQKTVINSRFYHKWQDEEAKEVFEKFLGENTAKLGKYIADTTEIGYTKQYMDITEKSFDESVELATNFYSETIKILEDIVK